MDAVFFVCLWGISLLTIEGFSHKCRTYSTLLYGGPDFYVNTFFNVHLVANKVKTDVPTNVFKCRITKQPK